MAGTLYIVSTPIGNLEDITLRALRILRSVSLIACEDTRHSARLLQHFQISTPTVSYYDFNESERTGQIIDRLQQGESVALVSDAGTPLLSDPGFVLVRESIRAGIRIEPVPGSSALLACLVAAGFPANEFFFAGFLPAKAAQRRRRLRQLISHKTTLVFYESSHRIVETLEDLVQLCPDAPLAVGRELTKLHEEFLRAYPAQVLQQLGKDPKGEFVVVLDARMLSDREAEKSVAESVQELIDQGIDRMTALKQVAKRLGISKSEAYRRMQEST